MGMKDIYGRLKSIMVHFIAVMSLNVHKLLGCIVLKIHV